MNNKLNLLCHKLASASREVANCPKINDLNLKAYANDWLEKSKELLCTNKSVSEITFNHMIDILKYFNKVLTFNGLLPIDESL